jgi:SPRY domain
MKRLALLLTLLFASGVCAAASYSFRVVEPGIRAPAAVVVPPTFNTKWGLTSAPSVIIGSNPLVVSGDSVTLEWATAQATTGHSSGKWYWEVTFNANEFAYALGIEQSVTPTQNFIGGTSGGYSYVGYLPRLESAGTTYSTSIVSSTNAGTIGVAADLDKGVLTYTVNCTPLSSTLPFPSGATYFPGVSLSANQGGSATANFGASAFKCAVPAGYNAGW